MRAHVKDEDASRSSWKGQRNEFSAEASRRNQPCRQLDFRTSHFQNCKMINLCCFKQLSLWYKANFLSVLSQCHLQNQTFQNRWKHAMALLLIWKHWATERLGNLPKLRKGAFCLRIHNNLTGLVHTCFSALQGRAPEWEAAHEGFHYGVSESLSKFKGRKKSKFFC